MAVMKVTENGNQVVTGLAAAPEEVWYGQRQVQEVTTCNSVHVPFASASPSRTPGGLLVLGSSYSVVGSSLLAGPNSGRN